MLLGPNLSVSHRAVLSFQIKALETALKQRHEEELAAFPVGGDGGGDGIPCVQYSANRISKHAVFTPAPFLSDAGKEAAAAEEESSDDEPDTARSKREKAKRKKVRPASTTRPCGFWRARPCSLPLLLALSGSKGRERAGEAEGQSGDPRECRPQHARH